MPQLGNFSFDNKIIARGFTSVVYKGLDQSTKQKVAIKCIDESILDDLSKKKMLTNELNIQWQLKPEPYCVEIKGQFYQNDCIYIVSEFCEYGDLKSKIKEKGKFVEPKAVSYMLDIIKGFQTLIHHKIVHRDLKPSNIFISKKGVKIGDFGFAYKEVQNQKAEEINAPSAGSPLYMAPEVLEDGRSSSHSSDIWSLGVVFYEMVTGRLPFPAKNKEALIKLIDKIGIRTIIPESLSLKSKQFILRTLKKDPTKRMTPEEMITFQFDDQVLFKIKQHRERKKEQERKKIQEGEISTSSEEKISSLEKLKIEKYNQNSQNHHNAVHSEHVEDHKEPRLNHKNGLSHQNPQVEKKHIHQTSKQHEPQKPSSTHHSNNYHEHTTKVPNIRAPPQLVKNKTTFDQFDNNQHKGKNLLDPTDIHVQKFKRKSHQKKNYADQIHSATTLHEKQHKPYHEEEDHKNKTENQIKHRSTHDENHHHEQKVSPQNQRHQTPHTKQHHRHSEFNRQIDHMINHFEGIKGACKQTDHSKKTQSVHKHTVQKDHHHHSHLEEQKHNGTREHKVASKVKRTDSIMSVESSSGEHHWMKKQEIIEILLNQIDIIRFLSRIMHKIQELHHLHSLQRHANNEHHERRSSSRHSSESKQSHDGSSRKIENPTIYTQLKQLIYKTIMQIEKLQFLPDQQAYKFFRSQEFDQIRMILDTYKTKLQLVAVKAGQWKGIKSFENELQKEILMVHGKIRQRVAQYEGHHLDSQSRELRKLTRKIEALNYLIVLRFDYLIMQREQVFINQAASNKNGKYYEQCLHIKAIIDDKHSKNNQTKKSLEECKIDLRVIEKKMRQIKLI